MGPILLLDKSGIQSMPRNVCSTMSRYYFLNIPPVLVLEIRADLQKKKQGGSSFVKSLADKLAVGHSVINVDHEDLRAANLRGTYIEMRGRPVVEAETFNTSMGPASLVSETDNHEQLLRFRTEHASPSDERAASEWRSLLKSIDLEKLKRDFKVNNNLPRVRTVHELGTLVDSVLFQTDQNQVLEICMADAPLDDESKTLIRNRWSACKVKEVSFFAPYTFFCFRVRMLFHVGLSNDLISTLPTNTVDLIYLYYAPFCNVFSSNDGFHKLLAPLVLRPDQAFVNTTELRRDLESISYVWQTLSNEEQRLWREHFGQWPVRNPNSFTYRMWLRLMRPPRRNRPRQQTAEAKARMNDDARRAMQSFREIQDQMRQRHRASQVVK
jgi:hypothetical protein